MDHHFRNIKTHLETLTTNELIKMADAMGIFIPLDLERSFIIQELLEAGVELNTEEPQRVSEDSSDAIQTFEFAPLPKQYNVNYLEVLLRDPLWAFVYWEINSLSRKTYESFSDFKGFILHVEPLPFKGEKSLIEPFSISVGSTDTFWGIYIQPEMKLFQVKLCAKRGERKEMIVSSREINVPQPLDPGNEKVRNCSKYPMLGLSGIEEFEIIHNIDKTPRVHRFSEN
jgi:hypothetical protein